MPNRYQLTFLASSLFVFLGLYFISHFISEKLGYHLILSSNSSMSTDFFHQNYANALALALAALTTLFIFLKFAQPSQFSSLVLFHSSQLLFRTNSRPRPCQMARVPVD
jgi:hypothetical protein